MNKRFGILMVFILLVGAVFLSACQREEVGGKLNLNKAQTGVSDAGDRVNKQTGAAVHQCCDSDYNNCGGWNVGDCASTSNCASAGTCVDASITAN